jgi:hypothetical protein
MYTYTDLELVSSQICAKVASIDAPKMSKDVKNYVAANTLSYYILINTWLLLIKEMAGHAWSFVAEMITRIGLIGTIATCQKEAQAVVKGEATAEVTELIKAHLAFEGSFFDDSNVTHDPVAALLFLLRYPKRFSPNNNDIIKEETLQDFIATENRTKQLSLKGYSPFVLRNVKDVILRMYDWDALCDSIEQIEPTDALFSNGVGQDSGSSLGSKLLAIAKGNHGKDYFMRPFGVTMIPIPTDSRESIHYSEVIAVPKSYKASRIIAPEDTYRQAIAKRVEYIFREFDQKAKHRAQPEIWLEDQGINQHLAELGSCDGSLATLDASHASDMISKVLFRSLFPNRFVSLIEPLLDTHVKVKGKLRLMHMLSTSGHSLTFRLETIVYKAIAQAAAEYTAIFVSSQQPFAWAYGDDVIINSDAAPLAVEWYQALGLMINTEKSFWSKDHLYRESCGKEYYRGIDLSTVAFPRFPIIGSLTPKVSLSEKTVNDEYRGKIDSSLTMLISLEKKLFPYSRDAAYLVLEVLKAADKRLTTSLPGTNSTDPWGYIDTGKPVSLHAYEIVQCKLCTSWCSTLDRYNTLKEKAIRASLGDYTVEERSTRIFQCDLPYDQADREYLERLANLDKYHSCPVVRYVEPEGAKDEELRKQVYDLYRYQNFLQHGPKYDSELDRLLKVSSKPMTYSEFYGRKKLVMAYTR